MAGNERLCKERERDRDVKPTNPTGTTTLTLPTFQLDCHRRRTAFSRALDVNTTVLGSTSDDNGDGDDEEDELLQEQTSPEIDANTVKHFDTLLGQYKNIDQLTNGLETAIAKTLWTTFVELQDYISTLATNNMETATRNRNLTQTYTQIFNDATTEADSDSHSTRAGR